MRWTSPANPDIECEPSDGGVPICQTRAPYRGGRLDWQAISAASSQVPKEIALTQLILSLAEWPDKQAVIETLEEISQTDADFHDEEKLLISIVKTYWQYDGLDAPGSKIRSRT